MKIGFNYKGIKKFIAYSMGAMSDLIANEITTLSNRVTMLENNEWVEITSDNGQEAEITQAFSEIRMLAKVGLHSNYIVTVPYDSNIFHNTSSNAPTYIIAGNPIENNYGCKFKYMIANNKQYVCAENCFEGGGITGCTFRAWIKPKITTNLPS